MDLTGTNEYEIVPEYNGNRDDASPIKIRCKYLSGPEREACISKDLFVESEKVYSKVTYKGEKLVSASVKGIDNFTWNGVPIRDAKAFNTEPIPSDLYDEVVSAIVAHVKRRDLKN